MSGCTGRYVIYERVNVEGTQLEVWKIVVSSATLAQSQFKILMHTELL